MSQRAQPLTGLDAIETATALLQRIRRADPTAGLYDSGEVQWWWISAAPATDDITQWFWFDAADQPVGAAITTDWGGDATLDVIVMPGTSASTVAEFVAKGVTSAADHGFDDVSMEVAPEDDALRAALTDRGFAVSGDGLVECWLDAADRPLASPIADGYRLTTRAESGHLPHHMNGPRARHADVEPRLTALSLYRPDLDLVVYTDDDDVAGYGMFWFDPTTATGVVEPMRTEDAHQRRGLARHILTAGVQHLAAAGATRIKICFKPANPASSALYPSVGFRPHRRNDTFTGPTR